MSKATKKAATKAKDEPPVAPPLEEQADALLSAADAEELLAENPVGEDDEPGEKPPPVIRSGNATVRLVTEQTDVYTPEDAVEAFIGDVVRDGFNSMIFVVSDDETGDVFYVHNGEVVDVRPDGEGGFMITDYYDADDEAGDGGE